MAISFVNAQSGTPNTLSSPGLTSTSVVTKPTGLAVGDLMVAVVHGNQAGVTAPAGQGWTRLLTQDASVNLYRMEIWWVVATSTHTAATNFTWTDGDASSPFHATIAAYRGVSQSAPINASQINVTTTTTPKTTPNITTTTTSMVLYLCTVRRNSSGATTAFSSSITNERLDVSNHSTGVSYNMALYDSGAQQAAGSISGTSITIASTPVTDGFAVTMALAVGDVSASAGGGAATAAAYNAQALTGQSVTAGRAATTAAVPAVSVFAGKVVNTVGVAATTAAVPDVGRKVQPTAATTTVSAIMPLLFFGTPSFRLKQVPAESRVIAVGTNREAAG